MVVLLSYGCYGSIIIIRIVMLVVLSYDMSYKSKLPSCCGTNLIIVLTGSALLFVLLNLTNRNIFINDC